MIRLARPADLPLLPDVERAASTRFRGTHMAFAADHQPSPRDALDAAMTARALWVAVDVDDRPLGFAFGEAVGGWFHILEMSVHTDHHGRGLGTSLLDAVAAAAHGHGCDRLSLTTDRTLAWNAPFYARRGFVELAAADQPAWLAGILAREAAHGLRPEWRCAMVRRL